MPEKIFKFSKEAIKDLPIPADKTARVRYYDSVSRGLCLRVTGNGAKSFMYYRKIDGKVVSKFFGAFPDLAIERARGMADEFNSKKSVGEKPWEQSRIAKEEITLRDLFNEYLERHAKKTRKTWQVMQKDFDRFAVDIAGRRLSAITPSMAENLHGELGKTRGTYAANRAVQLLKAVYNKGRMWHLFEGENPFVGITLFAEKPRNRFLSRQEAVKLLAALDKHASESLRDIVKLSLFTGVRKHNILSMRWADIDFAHKTWTIPDTKNGTEQKIALGVNELAILKERKKTSLFVFPSGDKSKHLTDIKKSWNTLRNKAGIPDCTIHDLRRSLGAAMASANINIALVKSALNHKDMKTTLSVYALTHKEAERNARESVQAEWLKAEDEAEEISVFESKE